MLKPQSNDPSFLLGERAQQLPRHQPILDPTQSWVLLPPLIDEGPANPIVIVDRGRPEISIRSLCLADLPFGVAAGSWHLGIVRPTTTLPARLFVGAGSARAGVPGFCGAVGSARCRYLGFSSPLQESFAPHQQREAKSHDNNLLYLGMVIDQGGRGQRRLR